MEVGASSVDGLIRIPKAKAYHRRTSAWTDETFWNATKKFFHVRDEIGPLFRHAR
jgi:hypothetical protein